MKDFYGEEREFEVGKLVICEWPLDGLLTKYKPYTIQGTRPDEGRVVLIDDHGQEVWARSDRFLYYPYTVTVPEDAPQFNNLDELMHEIAYSWDYSTYPQTLHRAKDGLFHANKLTVGPGWSEYKGNYYKFDIGLYVYLSQIYEIITAARRQYGLKKWDGTDSEVDV